MRLRLSTLELLDYFAPKTGLFDRAADKVTGSSLHFLFSKSPSYRYCASVTSFQVRLYHVYELAIISPALLLSTLPLSFISTYKSNIIGYQTYLAWIEWNTLAAPRPYT